MNCFNKFLVATFMSVAMLLPNMVQAMEIQQFDKMAVPDQSEYVGLLVQGAEKVLTDKGRSDLAAQIESQRADGAFGSVVVNLQLPSAM